MRAQPTEKKIYVIGHRNPDTDSVVAAAAYANFKQLQGVKNCFAARAGKPTPQTEYIFNRFKVPMPELIPDLIPKVQYYYKQPVISVKESASLWEALKKIEAERIRVLPVITEDGTFHSILHYSAFAQKILQMVNPQQKTVVQTSLNLLSSVIDAQVILSYKPDELKKSPILIAGSEFSTFCEHLKMNIPENTIVLSGDRRDIQEYAIKSNVRILICTGGIVLSKELRSLAEKHKVSVIISPYDTLSTALLLIYSMPVTGASSQEITPLRSETTVKKAATMLADAPAKTLPVVDNDNKVIGIVTEGDIYREANIEIILVDHNEQTQAVEGVENFKIIEIIDHHRVGNMPTKHPITFINKPVGATCTIIANLYREQRIPLDYNIAGILLCGILADTLMLQSATTTDIDRNTAEYLANITNIDLETLGKELLNVASNIAGRSADQLIHQDMKEYHEGSISFTVSQIEVEDQSQVLERKQEFIDVLEAERQKGDKLFAALMITNITYLTSFLLIAAKPDFLSQITVPKQEESVYVLKSIVSRKKQLMPLLSEILAAYGV
ncbi:putative manganese-dependent inorganic diphosphatase [Treponema phagedenis]|nr:putative manganese-dependent inorganic diphosphatase [Treponema phagedenis]NVP23030.1 putative manganese-dependent inorganic diphosphatase [Treponema phagedenis]QEJ95151.1 putative manganese-dependent inorganic diphosphatase [Treponema phagedenis]QEJ98178.1 putative manganese-dependent inorganic diphosphatase [Treponema phagedenis]QEK01075.1 putative manganese-dependent inorganic diphosphatase [Treponema phagedenis]QEK03685.1 putative manganese-dependent inorganic diphosphatase [Treponema p